MFRWMCSSFSFGEGVIECRLNEDEDQSNDVSVELVGHLIDCLDADSTGNISAEEFFQLARV